MDSNGAIALILLPQIIFAVMYGWIHLGIGHWKLIDIWWKRRRDVALLRECAGTEYSRNLATREYPRGKVSRQLRSLYKGSGRNIIKFGRCPL
ncbi:hypothetical protein [Brunnivagina elsteri]|uniref:hypothetical protein n=1 Tax=Brunnivagina elsteri TaxID=1247191 RepID=UPI0011782AA7|nr:hypothetical protein [Calothrix elsteri]